MGCSPKLPVLSPSGPQLPAAEPVARTGGHCTEMGDEGTLEPGPGITPYSHTARSQGLISPSWREEASSPGSVCKGSSQHQLPAVEGTGRAVEMAGWVQRLPCEHEDLNSDPQNPHKRPTMTHIYIIRSNCFWVGTLGLQISAILLARPWVTMSSE